MFAYDHVILSYSKHEILNICAKNVQECSNANLEITEQKYNSFKYYFNSK